MLGYYYAWDGSDIVQSEPINGNTDPRQKIFWGSLNTTERNILVGEGTELEITFDESVPFNVPVQEGEYVIHYTANTEFTLSHTGDWFTAVVSGNTIVITAE